MRRLFGACGVAATLLCAGLSTGCASDPQRASLSDERWEAAPADDTIQRLRLTLRVLGTHPRAAEARDGLTRARGWLDRAEAMAAVEEVDEARIALLLEATEAQAREIKARYDRMAAAEAAGVPDEEGWE